MIHILTTAQRRKLIEFATRDVLLAFDFDGTLAPIVKHPEDAKMRHETRRLLSRAAQLFPVAVISGRSQTDVRALLGPVPVWEVVGNHGLEPSDVSERFEAAVRGWLPPLQQALAGVEGVQLEDKGLSIALHYRNAEDRAAAKEAIDAAVAQLSGARVLGGKLVVNVLPAGGPNKGQALRDICAKLRCPAAIYVGDDETDEDVFRLPSLPLLGIRVGHHRGSAAQFYLADQAEVDDLLDALIAARAGTTLPAAPRR